jgi:four helix bundle protein
LELRGWWGAGGGLFHLPDLGNSLFMAGGESKYDLDERTFQFALLVRECAAKNRWTRVQWSDLDQLLRASGSVPANYGEANNGVSTADFRHRIRLAKKEANESKLWSRLLAASSTSESVIATLRSIYKEADELVRILATIDRNSGKRKPSD